MKKYIYPIIQVIEVAVEAGIAGSGGIVPPPGPSGQGASVSSLGVDSAIDAI